MLLTNYSFQTLKYKVQCLITVIFKHCNIPIALVSVFMFFNIYYYQSLNNAFEKQHRNVLHGFKSTIEALLVKDLKQSLNNNLTGVHFAVISNFSIRNNLVNDKSHNFITPYMKVDKASLSIFTEKEKRIFDLQQIRDFVNNVLPSYILYKIAINKQYIVIHSNVGDTYIPEDEYKLGPNGIISFGLAIDNTSQYYLENIAILYNKIVLGFVISTCLLFILLRAYLKEKNQITSSISILQESLDNKDNAYIGLLHHQQAEQTIKNLFIAKVTQQYLSEIEEESISRELKNANSTKHYENSILFPIAIIDKSSSEIDIQEFKDILKNYFEYNFDSVFLEIESQQDALYVDCGKEVFYQIIISLIYNLIFLMKKQSEQAKVIKIDLQETKISISYDSFPLEKEFMIKLSENLLMENRDTFILDCNKIFQSLQEHNLNYYLASNIGVNKIEINTTKTVLHEERNSKILRFDLYRDRRCT